MLRPDKEGDQRNFHAHSLRAKLMGMLDGLEAEVALVVDVMLPAERLEVGLRPNLKKAFHLSPPKPVEAWTCNRNATVGNSRSKACIASTGSELIHAARVHKKTPNPQIRGSSVRLLLSPPRRPRPLVRWSRSPSSALSALPAGVTAGRKFQPQLRTKQA